MRMSKLKPGMKLFLKKDIIERLELEDRPYVLSGEGSFVVSCDGLPFLIYPNDIDWDKTEELYERLKHLESRKVPKLKD